MFGISKFQNELTIIKLIRSCPKCDEPVMESIVSVMGDEGPYTYYECKGCGKEWAEEVEG